ncbi:MAG: putative Isoprenylcysteine carboxyl methyltransferase [Mycobacterium sp.]|nr:putative Isoprenylcysteine carboxyl methyltransferase [Mycobacterium sp.]
MGHALLALVYGTVVVWLAAELVLQLRQYRQGSRARVTERLSLVVFVVLAYAGWQLAVVAARRLPQFALPHPVAVGSVGLVVAWCGIAFRLWAIRSLGRFFRGVVHIQEGHRVVQSGPYRWLRHPSYSGGLLAVLGFSLTFGNAVSALVFFAAFLAALLYRIRAEERVLFAELGDDYARYAARTRRLIPGVW